MKMILTLCLSVCLVITASSQNLYKNFDRTTKKEGIIDADGNIVIPAIYDLIFMTGPNLFLAKLDKKYGLVNERNMIVSPFEWDSYNKVIGPHALYTVTRKNKVGLLNRTGVILQPEYDEIDYRTSYNRNFIRVSKNKKQGFIDTLGNVRIPVAYEKTSDFIFGMVSAMNKGKWGLVDTFNNVKLPFEYDCCFKGLSRATRAIIAYRAGKLGTLDSTGSTIVPFEFVGLTYSAATGLFPVKKNEKYGLIDTFGRLVTPPVYDTFLRRQPGYVWFLQNSKWGAVDSRAKIKINFKYSRVGEWINEMLPVMIDDKGGYLDAQLQEQIPLVYDGVANFSNNLAWVKQRNLFGQIKRDGSFNLPLQFEGIALYEDNYTIVQKDGKFGIVNPEGKMILPVNYDRIGYSNTKKLFEQFCTPFFLRKKVGMVHANGKILVAPEYYRILVSGKYLYALKEKSDRQVSVFDDRGTFLQFKSLTPDELKQFIWD